MHISNLEIKQLFAEPGLDDNFPDDPFTNSDADTMLAYLEGKELKEISKPVRSFMG